MPYTIPGSGLGNPFAWAEINARRNDTMASEANARGDQAQRMMLGAELDRQNSLVAPELAGRTAHEVAAAEFPFRQRLAQMEIAARQSSGGSSGPTGGVPAPDGGEMFAIGSIAWDQMSDEQRAEWEPVIGAFNNRGVQYFRRRPTGDPVVPPAGAVSATNAIQDITAEGTQNAPAPQGTDEAVRQLREAGFTIRPNTTTGQLEIVDPNGQVVEFPQ